MGTLKRELLWLLFVHSIAIVGYWLLQERFAPVDIISPIFKSNFLFWSWANFDGEHYLTIAHNDYGIRGGFPQYAFFPLLPVLIRIFSFFTIDYLVAGLLVSFISLYFILKLLPKNLHLPLLLSPGAVFLGAVYTEPLFIALALGVFYFAERKEWLKAAIVTGLATATRVNGIFLILFLALKMWDSRVKLKDMVQYLPLSFLGIISYMTYLYYKTGDAFAWYHSQAYWGKAEATSPVETAISYFRALTTQFKPDLVHLVVIFEVMITIWALYLVAATIKNRLLSLPYYAYLLGNILMPIATGSLGSMPRFFLILFPSYIVISKMDRSKRILVYTIYSLMMVTGVILFTRGYWYA